MATKQWIRTTTRDRIYRRDGYRCVWCLTPVYVKQDQTSDMATLDHVVPRSVGGSNLASNLITCCSCCNSFRKDRDPERFALFIARQDTADTAGTWDFALAILARVCRAMGTKLPK